MLAQYNMRNTNDTNIWTEENISLLFKGFVIIYFVLFLRKSGSGNFKKLYYTSVLPQDSGLISSITLTLLILLSSHLPNSFDFRLF